MNYKTMSTDGITKLRFAILRQAVQDYKRALKKNDKPRAGSIEIFFKSEWGELLSNNNGAYIIEKCKAQVK